jgi:hypothetical protein
MNREGDCVDPLGGREREERETRFFEFLLDLDLDSGLTYLGFLVQIVERSIEEPDY